MFYTSRGFSTLRATTAAGSGAPLPFTRCVDEGCTPSEAPRPSQEGGSQVVSHSTYWSDRYAPIRDVGKRAYASFLRDCRFHQEKNVIVIQYERETADVATCEQRGDFPFECDRSLSGHN